MDINLIISISGIGIGLIGLFVAFYQSKKVKRVNDVVTKWGADLSERLKSSENSMGNLTNLIDSFDQIQWAQSKSHVIQAVGEQKSNISQICRGMNRFLSTVSDMDKIDEPK